jgi:hypothetical protein
MTPEEREQLEDRREAYRQAQKQKFSRILLVIATTALLWYMFGPVVGFLGGIWALLLFDYESR